MAKTGKDLKVRQQEISQTLRELKELIEPILAPDVRFSLNVWITAECGCMLGGNESNAEPAEELLAAARAIGSMAECRHFRAR